MSSTAQLHREAVELQTTNQWFLESVAYQLCSALTSQHQDNDGGTPSESCHTCILHWLSMWKHLSALTLDVTHDQRLRNWAILVKLLSVTDRRGFERLVELVETQCVRLRIEDDVAASALRYLHTNIVLCWCNDQNVRKARLHLRNHDVLFKEQLETLLKSGGKSSSCGSTLPGDLVASNLQSCLVPYIRQVMSKLGRPRVCFMVSRLAQRHGDEEGIQLVNALDQLLSNNINNNNNHNRNEVPGGTRPAVNDQVVACNEVTSSGEMNVRIDNPIDNQKEIQVNPHVDVPVDIDSLSPPPSPVFPRTQRSAATADEPPNSPMESTLLVNESTSAINPMESSITNLANESLVVNRTLDASTGNHSSEKMGRCDDQVLPASVPKLSANVSLVDGSIVTIGSSKGHSSSDVASSSKRTAKTACSRENTSTTAVHTAAQNAVHTAAQKDEHLQSEQDASQSDTTVDYSPTQAVVLDSSLEELPSENELLEVWKRKRRVKGPHALGSRPLFKSPIRNKERESHHTSTEAADNDGTKEQCRSPGNHAAGSAQQNKSPVNKGAITKRKAKSSSSIRITHNDPDSGESVVWTSDEEEGDSMKPRKKKGRILHQRNNVNRNKGLKTSVVRGDNRIGTTNAGQRHMQRGSQRVKFSKEEEKYLIEGVKRFGAGSWMQIRTTYKFHASRTNVSIKDKYRTLVKQGVIVER